MGNRKFQTNAQWLGGLFNDREVTELDNDWVTGRYDPTTGLLITDPTLDAEPGKMWVHPASGRSSSQVLIGDRMWMLHRTAGKRVIVATNQRGQRVAYAPYVASDTAEALNGAIQAAALNQPFPAANVTGGRVLAHPNGGLQVWVEALPQVGWQGGALVVDSADLPTGSSEFRWLVIYFPAYSGTPVEPTYAGTVPVVRPSKEFVPEDAAFNLALAAGVIRTYAFTVFTGETDITNANTRWLDLRRLVPEGVVTEDVAAITWTLTHDVTVPAGRSWLLVGAVALTDYTLTLDGELSLQ